MIAQAIVCTGNSEKEWRSYQLTVQVSDAALPVGTSASVGFTLSLVNVEEGTLATGNRMQPTSG